MNLTYSHGYTSIEATDKDGERYKLVYFTHLNDYPSIFITKKNEDISERISVKNPIHIFVDVDGKAFVLKKENGNEIELKIKDAQDAKNLKFYCKKHSEKIKQEIR